MNLMHLELKHKTKDADNKAAEKAREAGMKLSALKIQHKVLKQKLFKESAEIEVLMNKAKEALEQKWFKESADIEALMDKAKEEINY